MKIVSAQYIDSQTAKVTYDDGKVRFVPLAETSWINIDLNIWLELGGKIEAAD